MRASAERCAIWRWLPRHRRGQLTNEKEHIVGELLTVSFPVILASKLLPRPALGLGPEVY
jgi:hypothetical protein